MRLLKIVICLGLVIWNLGFHLPASADPAVAKRKTFADIHWGYWAKGPIELLGGLGIINGYPDGTFRPEGTITRAEFTALLVKAKQGRLDNAGLRPFSDIPAGHWASAYIDKAMETELVKGYPDDTFKPNKTVSRAEAVSVMASFDNLITARAKALPFPDLKLSHWAVNSISAAKKAGLLDYLAGKNFKAQQPLTRAEVAELLAKTSFIKATL